MFKIISKQQIRGDPRDFGTLLDVQDRNISSKYQFNRFTFKVRRKIKNYYTPVVRFIPRVYGIIEKSYWKLFRLDRKTRVPVTDCK